MKRVGRQAERSRLRMGMLVAASASIHLILLVTVSGTVGGRPGVNRLPDVVCVSLVPMMGPALPPRPEAMRLDETRPDDLILDVSKQANVPEKVEEVHIDRLRKARLSKPDPASKTLSTTSLAERLVRKIPDSESSAALVKGDMDEDSRKGRPGPFFDKPSPVLIYKPDLYYPELARQRGWKGTVELEIEVLADGSVGDVFLLQSSGCEILDEAALTQVKQCRFRPAIENGIPESKRVIMPWRFELN